ncbi:MAG: histidine phosphatase family protein [Chloroflexi bacterium]|nr:histidine phosphatase family protein [Chloroflexota bacterium]
MPHLILIKHSLPEIIPNLPAREWHLSDEGRARCQILAKEIAMYSPRAIFSSVESKARETAQIVSAQLGVPFEIADDLHEHLRASVGYTSQAQFENSLRGFFAHPRKLVFGDETADAAHARFARAVNGIRAAHLNETVGIVAHGTVIALFVARAATVAPFDFWKRMGLPAFVVMALPNLELKRVCETIAPGY